MGGLVALTFDENEQYLFVCSHSGRGIYDLATGERISRDYEVIYPQNGSIDGIGPLNRINLQVSEYDFENQLIVLSPSGKYRALGESDNIIIEERP